MLLAVAPAGTRSAGGSAQQLSAGSLSARRLSTRSAGMLLPGSLAKSVPRHTHMISARRLSTRSTGMLLPGSLANDVVRNRRSEHARVDSLSSGERVTSMNLRVNTANRYWHQVVSQYPAHACEERG